MRLLTLASLLLFSLSGFSNPLSLKKLSTAELSKISPPIEISVKDPNESDAEIKYKALPLNKILDKFYGTKWSEAKEIIFTCVDGYKPSIPISEFKNHKAYLAVERVGSKKFEITKNDGKKVNVGPYYLVWEGGVPGYLWPYQLAGLDLWTGK